VTKDRASDETRDNVERPAAESSAPHASPTPLLLSLQQSAGNRAVAGLIQRLRDGTGETRLAHDAPAPSQRLLQRAPWRNVEATFQTENDEGAPNSEYDVKETTYRRYAPINLKPKRDPEQVYQEGPRSFAYIDAGQENQADYASAAKGTTSATVNPANGDEITLKGEYTDFADEYGVEIAGKPLKAHRRPRNGLAVWDAEVADNGTVKKVLEKGSWEPDVHVGHTVANLGTHNDLKLRAAKAGKAEMVAKAKADAEAKAKADADALLADLEIGDPGQANFDDLFADLGDPVPEPPGEGTATF
jgi:hypothetical protein